MKINLSLFIADSFVLLGLIFGLGAVTVIDLHGFLGRKSEYWTLATVRTHKITKPLIWLGSILLTLGITLHTGISLQLLIAAVLILNGCFLTFGVSRHLLEQERQGKADQILSQNWQKKITCSFIVSLLGWWYTAFWFLLFLQAR